ncbi:MAG: dual specificity protein phosphatase family protein [Alphaproteobacteria bacterium]
MAQRLWWIDEPTMAGGPNPTDDELTELRGRGFTTIVCLLDPGEQAPNYDVERAGAAGFRRHEIPIRDFGAPTLEQIETFVRIVERFGPASGKTLVHCEGGTGRTGTMAAAYWIARGLTAEAAIEKVRRARPKAVEEQDQELRLREYERRRVRP